MVSRLLEIPARRLAAFDGSRRVARHERTRRSPVRQEHRHPLIAGLSRQCQTLFHVGLELRKIGEHEIDVLHLQRQLEIPGAAHLTQDLNRLLGELRTPVGRAQNSHEPRMGTQTKSSDCPTLVIGGARTEGTGCFGKQSLAGQVPTPNVVQHPQRLEERPGCRRPGARCCITPGRPYVLDITLDHRKRTRLVGLFDEAKSLTHHRCVVRGVSVPGLGVCRGILLEIVLRILPEEFVHRVTPRLPVGGEKRLVHEVRQIPNRGPGHGPGGITLKSALEHGQLGEQVPLGVAE